MCEVSPAFTLLLPILNSLARFLFVAIKSVASEAVVKSA